MFAMLISDNPDEMAILSIILRRAGYAVLQETSIEPAVQYWLQRPADIVVLAMDQGDPMKHVRRIRSETDAALMFIMGPVSEMQHAQLLEEGADLVVSRPYSARVLIAQLRAFARRAQGMIGYVPLPVLELEGISLDPLSRSVKMEGSPPQRLTHLEFRLLYTLALHRGQILPSDMIVERVWGYSGEGNRQLVRNLISRLRAKIEPDPNNPQYILTVPGVGYHFVVSEEGAETSSDPSNHPPAEMSSQN